MKLSIFLSTHCCLLFFLAISCDFIQQDLQQPRSYMIEAPKLTPEFQAWLRQSKLKLQGWHWQLNYVGSSHQNNGLKMRSERRNGSHLKIELKKQESLLLLAFPRFSEFSPMWPETLWRPAGAAILWQNHNEDEYASVRNYPILATWQEGFFSYILTKLLNGGFDIRYFNADKLKFYLQERIKQKKAEDFILNSWDYDWQHIVTEISTLEMDWYDIRQRKHIKTLKGKRGIPLGRWQALNIAKAALNCPCQPELAIGSHYFWELNRKELWQFAVQADGEVFALKVDNLK